MRTVWQPRLTAAGSTDVGFASTRLPTVLAAALLVEAATEAEAAADTAEAMVVVVVKEVRFEHLGFGCAC
jgi:hypothetical protein